MSRADEYVFQGTWRRWPEMLDQVESRLPNQSFKGLRVADLGCGVGLTTRLIAQRGADVVGVDGDEYLLRRAKADAPQLRFELADVTSWVPDRLVDVVWASFVVAYTGDATATLLQWVQMLKPGGVLAVVEIDGLFMPHSPLEMADWFKRFETRGLQGYNSRAGGQLLEAARATQYLGQLQVTDWRDPELAPEDGPVPADSPVWKGWELRFKRLEPLMRDFGGPANPKDLFFACLAHPEHRCRSMLKLLVCTRLNAMRRSSDLGVESEMAGMDDGTED